MFLGAGSSVPSGAPVGSELVKELAEEFDCSNLSDFSLADIATVIEQRRGRHELVTFLRNRLGSLTPSGGILNIPRFDWVAIYTTNYDNLIEMAFRHRKVALSVFSSNYDFTGRSRSSDVPLYKLHGTLDKDEIDGHRSRLILTAADYDIAAQYREVLYARLSENLMTSDVIIVGYSLSDPHLRELIDQAQKIKSRSGAPGHIYVLVFQKDEERALIYETRGLTVAFGGIDELLAAIEVGQPSGQLTLSLGADAIDVAPELNPATIDVIASRANGAGRIERMYNGSPASYADIARKWVFERTLSKKLETQLLSDEGPRIAYILGPAGVGKTTAVRIALSQLVERGIKCWEHKPDFDLSYEGWTKVDSELRKRGEIGIIFIDDAHTHLREINELSDRICKNAAPSLKIVLVSNKAHWNPRIKSPSIFAHSREYIMHSLDGSELNSLLNLLENSSEIKSLVDDDFMGFSRPERLTRLKERCNADMFVCMKNIFSFQSIDNIILAEYAALSEEYQSVYKVVAGMQAVGVRVHREFVRRVTGLEARLVSRLLDDLEGIIDEYDISQRNGIYGWSVRHSVIAAIVAKYKYVSQDDLYELFKTIVENINPSYSIEVQSINNICDLSTGVARITNKEKQNVLLRHMISHAPREHVPRHRLIFNLIEQEKFDVAEREIRLFEKELRLDSPLHRYKVKLLLRRAQAADGIMTIDRAAMAQEGYTMAEWGISRFQNDKNMYRSLLEASVAIYKYSKDASPYEDAMAKAQVAFDRILDPDLRRTISLYQNIGERMGIALHR